MNRQRLIYAALAVFLVSMAVWWFFNTFEYKVQEKDTGFSSAARHNRYLAAERFLKKFGMQTKSIPSMLEMKQFPETSDVLLIPTGRYDLSADKVHELMGWVKRGGHLIVRARRIVAGDTAKNDNLFNMLGVETYRKAKKNPFGKDKLDVITVHVNSNIEDKQVVFDGSCWIKATGKRQPSWRVDSKNGSHILEYQIGDGYISVLSDLDFMDNSQIAKHDDAALLYTLVHMTNDTQRVWIVQNDNMPSLISVIANKAPATLVSLGILLLLWLWYTTRRFGPLQKPAASNRRSLREHIIASGLYQWRNHNRTSLFLNVKTALLEQVTQTRPLWTQLSEKELADKLSKIAGIPADKVLGVLQSKAVDKENEFTQYIEVLSLIRKRL